MNAGPRGISLPGTGSSPIGIKEGDGHPVRRRAALTATVTTNHTEASVGLNPRKTLGYTEPSLDTLHHTVSPTF
ncbi:hypothetical protein J4Q44_G00202610 [Coregonus suidteri]|uniref:Uncharacterized protein n=1 Tax=Coregonus suidteri TaxID=861788 RepID=A0AAN8LEF4_9TELE